MWNVYGMYMERIGMYQNSHFEREGRTERIGMYSIGAKSQKNIEEYIRNVYGTYRNV